MCDFINEHEFSVQTPFRHHFDLCSSSNNYSSKKSNKKLK